MLTLKLVPDPDVDGMVKICQGSYKKARVYRDVFYDDSGASGSIYNRLCKGETVVVELRRVTTPNH